MQSTRTRRCTRRCIQCTHRCTRCTRCTPQCTHINALINALVDALSTRTQHSMHPALNALTTHHSPLTTHHSTHSPLNTLTQNTLSTQNSMNSTHPTHSHPIKVRGTLIQNGLVQRDNNSKWFSTINCCQDLNDFPITTPRTSKSQLYESHCIT